MENQTPTPTPTPHRTVSAIFKTHSDALDTLRQGHVSKPGGPSVIELEFAATLLLVELASSDHNYSQSEHRTIFNGVRRLFGSSPEKTEALIREARAYLQSPMTTSHFTALLREHVSDKGRQAILSVVDEVVEADGILEGVELYVRNKFVRQLGLSDHIAPRTETTAEAAKKKKEIGNAPPDRARITNDEWP